MRPGTRVLVTGASRRLGRAITLGLAERGARVALHHRSNAEAAEEARRLVMDAGGEAAVLRADLTDRGETDALVDDATELWGGLDHLVISAARFEQVELRQASDALWDATLELNLTAAWRLVRRALPALEASRGSVVLLTCSSGVVPMRQHLPYVVSKGALRHLMRTLALELAPAVRVNAVAPGIVDQEEQAADPAGWEPLRRKVPLQRFSEPGEIAAAVLYLLDAPTVTGQEIAVDGGRSGLGVR